MVLLFSSRVMVETGSAVGSCIGALSDSNPVAIRLHVCFCLSLSLGSQRCSCDFPSPWANWGDVIWRAHPYSTRTKLNHGQLQFQYPILRTE
jgi:hypothetical protein